MLIKTHIVFGLLLYLLVVTYVQNSIVFLIGVLIGVVIVDIDSKTSTIGKSILLRPIQLFLRHRGLTHSLLFGFILTAIFYTFSVNFSIGFIIGFLSHVFLDCLTPRGVALLWPLSNFKFKFFIKSGGYLEDILFVLILLLDLYLFVMLII